MSVERRLRIFQPHNNNVHKSKSTTDNLSDFKIGYLSSYNGYLSGIAFLSDDTIIEEHWSSQSNSTLLTALRLLRIKRDTFEHHPFLNDISYGKHVTKLSFDGPCSPTAVLKALENFPAIDTLEFGPEFFIHEDFDRDEMLNVPWTKEFPGIKSLTVNVDAKKYFELTETEKALMDWRIILCLNSDSFQHLNHCSLSLPNTPSRDWECWAYLLIENGLDKGKKRKWTEQDNKQVNLCKYKQ